MNNKASYFIHFLILILLLSLPIGSAKELDKTKVGIEKGYIFIYQIDVDSESVCMNCVGDNTGADLYIESGENIIFTVDDINSDKITFDITTDNHSSSSTMDMGNRLDTLVIFNDWKYWEGEIETQFKERQDDYPEMSKWPLYNLDYIGLNYSVSINSNNFETSSIFLISYNEKYDSIEGGWGYADMKSNEVFQEINYNINTGMVSYSSRIEKITFKNNSLIIIKNTFSLINTNTESANYAVNSFTLSIFVIIIIKDRFRKVLNR